IDCLSVDEERDVVDTSGHEWPGSDGAAAEESATRPADVDHGATGTKRTLFRLSLSRPSCRLSRPPCLSRLACPSTAALRRQRCNRLHAQIPAGRLDSRLVTSSEDLSGNLAHLAARGVGDFQLDVADFLLVEPGDDS